MYKGLLLLLCFFFGGGGGVTILYISLFIFRNSFFLLKNYIISYHGLAEYSILIG